MYARSPPTMQPAMVYKIGIAYDWRILHLKCHLVLKIRNFDARLLFCLWMQMCICICKFVCVFELCLFTIFTFLLWKIIFFFRFAHGLVNNIEKKYWDLCLNWCIFSYLMCLLFSIFSVLKKNEKLWSYIKKFLLM